MLIYPKLSYQVVGVLFDVYNDLGFGFPEKLYQRGIAIKFDYLGVKYVAEAPYKLILNGKVIGRRYIDFIIDHRLVLEIKQGRAFTRQHYNQINQYLSVTGYKLAIMAIFSPTGLRFTRVVNLYDK